MPVTAALKKKWPNHNTVTYCIASQPARMTHRVRHSEAVAYNVDQRSAPPIEGGAGPLMLCRSAPAVAANPLEAGRCTIQRLLPYDGMGERVVRFLARTAMRRGGDWCEYRTYLHLHGAGFQVSDARVEWRLFLAAKAHDRSAPQSNAVQRGHSALHVALLTWVRMEVSCEIAASKSYDLIGPARS